MIRISVLICLMMSLCLAPKAFCSANSFARSPTIAINVVFTQRVARIKITKEIKPIKPLILSKICPSEAETFRIGRAVRSGWLCIISCANCATLPCSFFTLSKALFANPSLSNQLCANSKLTINMLSVASPASTIALIVNSCFSTAFLDRVNLLPTPKLRRSAKVLPIMAFRSSKLTLIAEPVICQ